MFEAFQQQHRIDAERRQQMQREAEQARKAANTRKRQRK